MSASPSPCCTGPHPTPASPDSAGCPGSVLAVVLRVAASAGFAFYATHFGSYNKIYGSLAGAVVFLVWLWLTNIAILLGAQFNAELARGRNIEQGAPPDQEPILPPREQPD